VPQINKSDTTAGVENPDIHRQGYHKKRKVMLSDELKSMHFIK
jgi:hypothetical protein